MPRPTSGPGHSLASSPLRSLPRWGRVCRDLARAHRGARTPMLAVRQESRLPLPTSQSSRTSCASLARYTGPTRGGASSPRRRQTSNTRASPWRRAKRMIPGYVQRTGQPGLGLAKTFGTSPSRPHPSIATRKAARTPVNGFQTRTGAGSPAEWPRSSVPTASQWADARRQRWSGSFEITRTPRWSPWCAGLRQRLQEVPDGPGAAGTTRSPGTATTGTAGSRGRRDLASHASDFKGPRKASVLADSSGPD